MIRLRILVADDHEVVRRGLRTILESHPGWEVCAEARTGREAVAKAKELNPGVVVLDFSMPDLNGLEATRQIRQALPQTEVLILTMHDSERLAFEFLTAGARGYLLKADAGKDLVAAVEQLRQHRPFFTSKVSDLVLSGFLHPKRTGAGGKDYVLTARESEVVQLIAEGKISKEIADRLDISVNTVETHRTNIMRKLNIHTVGQLVRYAIRNKLAEP